MTQKIDIIGSDYMPKPKPDQVIRHEIVFFGRSERELISDGLLAYQVNKEFQLHL